MSIQRNCQKMLLFNIGRVEGVADEPNQEDVDFDEDVDNGADAGDLFDGPDHQVSKIYNYDHIGKY